MPCPCPRCSNETGPVPDDGTGCCSFLPEDDILGSVTVQMFATDEDGDTTAAGNATVDGPFVYYPGEVQISSVGWLGSPGAGYSGDQGYYVAGPVCLSYTQRVVIDPGPFGGGGGTIAYDIYRSVRVYAVLACVAPIIPPELPQETPRVRLFIVSNFGQSVTSLDPDPTPPTNCDDAPFDDWLWDIDPDGPDTIVADTGFMVFSTGSEGGLRATCDPLCLVADGYGTFQSPTARVTGVIGEIPCDVPDEDECACRPTITYREFCPEDCPEGAGPEWTVFARDDVSLEEFGPGVVDWERDDEGNCLWWSSTVEVCVPPDEITGNPPAERSYTVFREVAGSPPEQVAEVTIQDCRPVVIDAGRRPDFFLAALCLTGCPSGGMSGVTLSVRLKSADGTVTYINQTAASGTDGCVVVALPLPGPAGTYLIEVEAAAVTGYKTAIVYSETVELPARGEGCFTVDLGDVEHVIADDHVCTCGGPIQKCLIWDAHGQDTEINHNGTRWVGTVTDMAGFAQGPLFCGPAVSDCEIEVELWLDEDCNWQATRDGHRCGQFNTPCPPPPATAITLQKPALSKLPDAVAAASKLDPVSSGTAWGPLGIWPGITLGSPDWVRTNGSADPDACHNPPEFYAEAVVSNCTAPGGGGAPLVGEAIQPDATPMATTVVGGQVVRVPASAIAPHRPRRRSAWEVYLDLPAGHPSEPTRRAALCPHRSKVGCGCNTIRCGFYGNRPMPASTCLGCTIKDKYLPPTPR